MTAKRRPRPAIPPREEVLRLASRFMGRAIDATRVGRIEEAVELHQMAILLMRAVAPQGKVP